MSRKITLWAFLAVASCSTTARAAEFILQPISASGAHTVSGTEIRLDSGGQRVFLELKIRNFAPSVAKTYQATLNSMGYSSGISGQIVPAVESCPSANAAGNAVCAAAFGDGGTRCVDMDPSAGVLLQCEAGWINRTRTDWVFFGYAVGAAAVDISTPNYRWGATLDGELAEDMGLTYYGGRLAVDVPLDAVGTFTIGWTPGQGISFIADENNFEINPLLLTPGRITVLCTSGAQCDDGNACTSDSCNAQGSCVNTPNYNVATQCCNPATGELMTISDGNACTDDTCNTATGVVGHTNTVAGAACGNPANSQCDMADTCDGAGTCQSNVLPNGAPCGSETHTECNFADTCNGAGVCLANLQPAGTPCGSSSTGPCDAADTCNGSGACLTNTIPNNTPCDDGQFCTDDTRCNAGVCGGGAPHNCADSLTCTTDTCNEDSDICENVLDAGRCLIDGACYVDGDLEPGNTCAECDPAANTADWTTLSDGTLCNDGNACTGTGREGIGFDTCTGGVCAGLLDPQCNDQCEFAVPAVVGQNLSSNASAGDDGGTASCQINTHADIWFRYDADCDGSIFLSTTGSNLQPVNDPVLNVFDECPLNGGVEIACDDDSGVGLNAALIFLTQEGEDYFIRVSGFENNVGSIVLNLSPFGDCMIDGACYLEGALNPENDCQACIPQISPTQWSSAAEGTACGDPSDTECDSPDACDGAGFCEPNYKTDGIECSDDGIECTKNLCMAGMCTHPPEPMGLPCGDPTDTECDNPDSCDGGGQCVSNLEGPGFPCGDPSSKQCDLPDACNGAGFCHPRHSPNGSACNDGDICTSPDSCLDGICQGTLISLSPTVEAISSKHIRVRPRPINNNVAPVALRVTSPDWPCLLQWVDDNGALVPFESRVIKTAQEWGLIIVQDLDIYPDSVYEVVAECGTHESPPGITTTYLFGDINHDGIVDFQDVSLELDAFKGYFIYPFETYNVHPCVPDNTIDFRDINDVLDAFKELPYDCPPPCND